MTDTRFNIIAKLLKGYYLIAWKSHNGTKCYRFYEPNGNPVANIQDKTIRTMDRMIDPEIKIWKKDKLGKITLNLSNVRKLHGKNTIKKLYLKNLKKTK